MSKQLAISAAISVMTMAIFVLYGPDWVHTGMPGDLLTLPDLSGFKAMFSN